MNDVDNRPEAQALFANLKAKLPELEKLLEQSSEHWTYEDGTRSGGGVVASPKPTSTCTGIFADPIRASNVIH